MPPHSIETRVIARWLLVALPGVVLAGFVLIPFLNKAFHIDDLTFFCKRNIS